jgi:hypothetical protein
MKNKLSKLKMPMREEVDTSELDMAMDGEEMAEGEEGDMEEMPSKESPLAGASDDELMAEMKKRGLMGGLEEGGEKELEMSDEEMYS